MTLTNEQKQELRRTVLEAMVVRHPAALAPRQIQRAVKRELDFLFEETDVLAALELLRGLENPLVVATSDPLGAGQYWAATAAGVLFVERS